MQGRATTAIPVLGTLLLAATVLGACDKPDAEPSFALPVKVAVVQPTPFSQSVNTISTLEALDEVRLAAQAGGRILQLRVRQGDRVKAGQLLMILDQTQLQAELADLMAQEQKNKLNFQRFEYLVRQGAASALQRDEFKASYIQAREAVRAKKADLGYKYLQAPIDGIVADVVVKPGDVISAGAPITSLIRNDRLMARIDVPAVYSDRIRPGLRVFLYQPGSDKVIAGALVNSVDPTVSPGSQSLLAKAGFTNPTGVLRNGLRLKTRLELDARLQPSVPFEAVTQSSGQSFVFVLGSLEDLKREPGQLKPDKLKTLPATSSFALQTPVKLGPLQNNRYPVVEGLQSGARVITSNLLKLRHGSEVKAY